MKRLFVSAVGLALAGMALAQAPFTIVRPADGAKVRETVHLLFPKNSVPQGGYIGIYINDKFVEATMPPDNGKYLDYALNTKSRGLKDGKMKIKAVLFGEGGDRPRRIDESEIEVDVANSTSITVPDDGLLLRYKFNPGAQLIYNLEQRIAISNITEAQAKRGGRPAQLPVESEKLRLLYAIDTSYGNGDGLVRIQALTPPGKDSLSFTSEDGGERKTYKDFNMASVYMKLASTGKELFSVIPTYFPMEGTGVDTVVENLYAVFPLPVFPTKAVKVGGTWRGSFQVPNLQVSKKDEVKTVVSALPARGDFVGVEWEMGHPCAKIRHSFEVGMSGEAGGNIMQRLTGVSGQKIEETIWFALDRKVPVKILREYTVDRKTDAPVAEGGGGGEGGGALGGGGGPSRAGASGGGGGGNTGQDLIQGPTRGAAGAPGQGASGRGGGFVGRGQGGGGAAGGGGGGAAAAQIIQRVTVQQILILEK